MVLCIPLEGEDIFGQSFDLRDQLFPLVGIEFGEGCLDEARVDHSIGISIGIDIGIGIVIEIRVAL